MHDVLADRHSHQATSETFVIAEQFCDHTHDWLGES